MSKIGNKVLTFIKNNDTNIITGIGIADGLLVGSYLWYKTGKKVNKRLTQKEIDIQRKLTFKEKVKETWKIFILPVCNTILSGGLLIYSARIGNKRLAALGAAYNLTEAALQQYIDKTKDIVGEKKANEIQEEVAKENLEQKGDKLVLINGKNEVTIHEPLTDRWFVTSWNKIENAAVKLNIEATTGMSHRISLTEWFYEIGLPKTDISDSIGWDTLNGEKIEINKRYVGNDDGMPCCEIEYVQRPRYFE